MKRIALVFLLSLTALFPAVGCCADSHYQAVRLVQSAASYYLTKGPEKTLDEISNPRGEFRDGELYVFAYDLTGSMLAHPNNALIGNDLTDNPDADGKLFRKDVIRIALQEGRGWVDYRFANPLTHKIEAKSIYAERVNDVIICCSIPADLD